jgi:hypothetical protein
MRTNRAPQDYNRRTPILPQLVDVCLKCGGSCYLRPSDNKRTCIFCHSTETDKLYENQIDTFIGGLFQIEHDKALILVGLTVLANP